MSINNESLGMSVEFAICEQSGLQSSHLRERAVPELVEQVTETVASALDELPEVTEHIGGHSDVDFLTANGSLSVKSNLKAQGKVAPQRCGQPTARTFTEFFRDLLLPTDDVDGVIPRPVMKRRVQERISDFIPIYLENLFDCDFLLWLWLNPSPGYRVISKLDIAQVDWSAGYFDFSKTPEDWNESCTVKYRAPNQERAVSIGEFQIHNNRDNYKFRFSMQNLLSVIAAD